MIYSKTLLILIPIYDVLSLFQGFDHVILKTSAIPTMASPVSFENKHVKVVECDDRDDRVLLED